MNIPAAVEHAEQLRRRAYRSMELDSDDYETRAAAYLAALTALVGDLADEVYGSTLMGNTPVETALLRVLPDTPLLVELRIRAAYRTLVARPEGWVGLRRLRAELGDEWTGAPRALVDQVLLDMALLHGVMLISEANQKTLTTEDREAAVWSGGEANHLISIYDSPSADPPRPVGEHDDTADEQPADIEARIRAAYDQLAPEPRAWVSLTDVRPLLGDAPRAQVDQVLKDMDGTPEVTVIPEANQRTLTDADRAAAVVIGGEANHLITIAPWEEETARGAPATEQPEPSAAPSTAVVTLPEPGEITSLGDAIAYTRTMAAGMAALQVPADTNAAALRATADAQCIAAAQCETVIAQLRNLGTDGSHLAGMEAAREQLVAAATTFDSSSVALEAAADAATAARDGFITAVKIFESQTGLAEGFQAAAAAGSRAGYRAFYEYS